MAHRSLSWLVALAMVGSFGAESGADTVELSGGGHVSGEVLRREPSGKLPHVVIRVDEGMTIALPESRVNRVVTSEQLREYRQLASQAGDDAEKHYQIAQWCAR